MPNVYLAYEPYVGIRTQFLNMPKSNFLPRRMPPYASVCQRITPCLKRIQHMPNIHLAYISVCQRMSDIFHTLAYASKIRYSMIPPLVRPLSMNSNAFVNGARMSGVCAFIAGYFEYEHKRC